MLYIGNSCNMCVDYTLIKKIKDTVLEISMDVTMSQIDLLLK